MTRWARQLRRNDTRAESILWRSLRGRRFAGYKFRRQQPIGRYIVDFLCLEASLAIELDGGQHGQPSASGKDAQRDDELAAMGIVVLRFWNWQVHRELIVVRNVIWETLQTRAPRSIGIPSPEPSPGGRGAKGVPRREGWPASPLPVGEGRGEGR
ncbi:MAG: endonuclease domain-containing protein [Verrucomicrobiales bacterium]|nr:endonuclease domain-containing protein [Verrucomicrobiales bacterium]